MTETRVPAVTARQRWQGAADAMLGAVSRFASPSGALISIPGPVSASGSWSDGLEGFARTALLAAFRVRGANGADPEGLLERYARGLAAGTDPEHRERWPTIAERRQAVVEAASVAIVLSETRPWLWDHLDPSEQQRTVEWLAGVVGTSGYTNNWTWFQVIIETFLATVGGPWRQDDLDRCAEIQESLYIGDGWYSDGAGPDGSRRSFDYYAGWAWHIYPLFQARMRDAALDQRHGERLRAFLSQAIDLIGSSGAPLFQGRSLTYRFAMLAPLWAGVLAGHSPLPAGRTREIADTVLDHFLDRGAIDERGLLSIGWHGEFLPIRQPYTGSSSPYWASKGMMGLLLPADHAEWTVEPARPSRDEVRARSFAAPGWLVVDSESDGVVRVLNHGSDGFRGLSVGSARADNPFYQRLGYSNVASPDLSLEGVASPLESHVALLDQDGVPSHRDRIERVSITDRIAVSHSLVHWLDTPGRRAPGGRSIVPDQAGWASVRRGPRVWVASVTHGIHELRLAWWDERPVEPHPTALADADGHWRQDEGPWTFRFGGWALPVGPEDTNAGSRQPTKALARRADGLTSVVAGVEGLPEHGVTRRAGGDPFAPASVTPWAAGRAPIGPGEVAAAVITLGSAETAELAAAPTVQISTERIEIRWHDGSVDVVGREAEVAE
ncbi:DUF2264 domain-containing protein [Microbacterium sp. HD4P20]|uniref:DUF2264 domain-containing protein n=1 Tax=Microbacterium sp. HD4P20 TaxID=2864874 RepID=UPI0020A3E2A4|nr:DUF2264 domain-containing protein [Microbacterium sp. HD4P20]MCP2638195.1 DUF2264 domain-containing protein [Microbacterium sp. HD4P20]